MYQRENIEIDCKRDLKKFEIFRMIFIPMWTQYEEGYLINLIFVVIYTLS